MNTSEWVAKWERVSPRGKLAMEFWAEYVKRYPADAATSNNLRQSGHADTNAYHFVPEANLNLCQYLMASRERVGIYIAEWLIGEPHAAVAERAQAYQSAVDAINQATGNLWPAARDIDLLNRANWPAAAQWLHETLAAYRRMMARPAQAGANGTAYGDT